MEKVKKDPVMTDKWLTVQAAKATDCPDVVTAATVSQEQQQQQQQGRTWSSCLLHGS